MKCIVIIEKIWNKTMLSDFLCITVILCRAYRSYLYLDASLYITLKSWIHNFVLIAACLLNVASVFLQKVLKGSETLIAIKVYYFVPLWLLQDLNIPIL